MNDKEIEKKRYNEASFKNLEKIRQNIYNFNIIGSKKFYKYLRSPFYKYESLIRNKCKSTRKINQLDLCCGDGIHSFTAAFLGANVIAIDYSEISIEIAKKRAKQLGLNIDFKVYDIENLPFEDESFDLITCVGSLSYVDHEKIINEIHRLLKNDGSFICLDSYNHNFIYRVNRFIHYLQGERSYSTLVRMPNNILLKKFKIKFNNIEIFYFGIFSFLSPIFNFFFGETNTSKIIDILDNKLSFLKKYAFKIVFQANKYQ